MKIACIGSRQTPEKILSVMESIGSYIAKSGQYVATGNAQGADQAFARGANSVDPSKVYLYLPWNTYEKDSIIYGNSVFVSYSDEHIRLAEQAHPVWNRLTQGAKKMMIRNAAIVSGSKLVLAWTDVSKSTGGTKHGIKIAELLGIKAISVTENNYSEIIMEIDSLGIN